METYRNKEESFYLFTNLQFEFVYTDRTQDRPTDPLQPFSFLVTVDTVTSPNNATNKEAFY